MKHRHINSRTTRTCTRCGSKRLELSRLDFVSDRGFRAFLGRVVAGAGRRGRPVEHQATKRQPPPKDRATFLLKSSHYLRANYRAFRLRHLSASLRSPPPLFSYVIYHASTCLPHLLIKSHWLRSHRIHLRTVHIHHSDSVPQIHHNAELKSIRANQQRRTEYSAPISVFARTLEVHHGLPQPRCLRRQS